MGSYQIPIKIRTSVLPESSCGYLLQELKVRFLCFINSSKLIWDEVGQDQIERETLLLDLEQECLDVYRRKVDSENISRAHMRQLLADSEAEFTHLLVSLGERSFPGRDD
ncbi:65-kDa microtubule-associated protein 8 [Acorus calamus]|uniref:65-kDa microtubule-associated protein 8 n=1 Tax=Acorus calamus TaxID=4465 RepID=A0AAV9BYX8_ACOCL|nr:65-kDa microtubule-associated protein 8 [Acorus calamus]